MYLHKNFKKLNSELAVTFLRTTMARGIAAFGGLMLAIVLGRLYGPAGVGAFALAQSIFLGAGILARYGMDNTLMRYVGQDYHSEAIITYLRWAIVKATLMSLVAAIVIFLLRTKMASWFNTPDLIDILLGISFAVPAFTLAFVLGGFMKGIRKPATACLLQHGSISLVATGVLFLINHITVVSITNVGWAFAIAGWVVLIQGAWYYYNWLKTSTLHPDADPISHDQFASSSKTFFIMSLAGFMQQVLSVLIAGWLLTSEDLGLFKSAERLALLINFILMVINAIFPPRFASLYREEDIIGLTSLARKSSLLGIGLAVPMLFLCLFFPELMLGLFGDGFTQAANLLQIIAIGQLINVATGSVGFLLNMTGYEKLMRNISLISNAFGLLMFFILIPLLGALGAALALSMVLILQNLIALIYVWRKLGIWMLPTPNFISWIATDQK